MDTIDIEIYGLLHSGPPEEEVHVPRRIRMALLAALPKEVTDKCFITLCKSTRKPVNDSSRSRRLIRFVADINNESLVSVVEALEQFGKEFDLQIVDGGEINDLKEFLAIFKSL